MGSGAEPQGRGRHNAWQKQIIGILESARCHIPVKLICLFRRPLRKKTFQAAKHWDWVAWRTFNFVVFSYEEANSELDEPERASNFTFRNLKASQGSHEAAKDRYWNWWDERWAGQVSTSCVCVPSAIETYESEYEIANGKSIDENRAILPYDKYETRDKRIIRERVSKQ